jgi:hypothetical protein
MAAPASWSMASYTVSALARGPRVRPRPSPAATWATFCQAGRNRASADGGTGSASLRSLARQRRRNVRSTEVSHHCVPRRPGTNSPSAIRPSAASRRSAPLTTATPSP